MQTSTVSTDRERGRKHPVAEGTVCSFWVCIIPDFGQKPYFVSAQLVRGAKKTRCWRYYQQLLGVYYTGFWSEAVPVFRSVSATLFSRVRGTVHYSVSNIKTLKTLKICFAGASSDTTWDRSGCRAYCDRNPETGQFENISWNWAEILTLVPFCRVFFCFVKMFRNMLLPVPTIGSKIGTGTVHWNFTVLFLCSKVPGYGIFSNVYFDSRPMAADSAFSCRSCSWANKNYPGLLPIHFNSFPMPVSMNKSSSITFSWCSHK
jgi:hypothetical protein